MGAKDLRELSDKARALEERVRLKEEVVYGKQMEARNAEQSLEAQRASADAKEQQVSSRGRRTRRLIWR